MAEGGGTGRESWVVGAWRGLRGGLKGGLKESTPPWSTFQVSIGSGAMTGEPMRGLAVMGIGGLTR